MAVGIKGDGPVVATVCLKRVVASLLRVAEMPAEHVPAAATASGRCDSLRAYLEVASLPSPPDPAERALFGCKGVRVAGRTANVLKTCASSRAMVGMHTHFELRCGGRAEPCMAYAKQEQLAGVWVAVADAVAGAVEGADSVRWVLALAVPRKLCLIPYDARLNQLRKQCSSRHQGVCAHWPACCEVDERVVPLRTRVDAEAQGKAKAELVADVKAAAVACAVRDAALATGPTPPAVAAAAAALLSAATAAYSARDVCPDTFRLPVAMERALDGFAAVNSQDQQQQPPLHVPPPNASVNARSGRVRALRLKVSQCIWWPEPGFSTAGANAFEPLRGGGVRHGKRREGHAVREPAIIMDVGHNNGTLSYIVRLFDGGERNTLRECVVNNVQRGAAALLAARNSFAHADHKAAIQKAKDNQHLQR